MGKIEELSKNSRRKGMFAFEVLRELLSQIQSKIEFIVLKKNERWMKNLNYLIEKNYKIEKKVDIKKWDEEFVLFIVDINKK